MRGWTERYAARAHRRRAGDGAASRAWLAAHRPPSGRPALIHNDFKYDNVVLDPAGLDARRRRARLGDGDRRRPAAWTSARRSPTGSTPDDPPALPRGRLRRPHRRSPAACARREVAERYAAATGRDLVRAAPSTTPSACSRSRSSRSRSTPASGRATRRTRASRTWTRWWRPARARPPAWPSTGRLDGLGD